jgi:hypothetical protein
MNVEICVNALCGGSRWAGASEAKYELLLRCGVPDGSGVSEMSE